MGISGVMVASVCVLTLLGGQPPQTATAGRAHSDLVNEVASVVERRYVFPDVGVKIADHIRARLRAGAYDRLKEAQLADTLTRDLRSINNDRHLSVQYQPGAAGAASAGAVRRRPGDGDPDEYRRRNYFLNRAERLDGNVGYLEVRRFFGQSEAAREALVAAMTFLGNTDAMIVDVRATPGGDMRMVDMLSNYFFGPEPVQTLAHFSRSRNETTVRTTAAPPSGTGRPDIPVYVLIGPGTASAAEDFAFLMQQTARATLIGARTAGAGHTVGQMPLADGFVVAVSMGRTFNPRTNEGWEGKGVQPEVQVPVTDALRAAHVAALSRLIEKTTDAATKLELMWTREAVEAVVKPPSIPLETLRRYAGSYGERTITVREGRLYYQRFAGVDPQPLVAVSPTEFAVAEGQRLQFADDAQGRPELRLLMASGGRLVFNRTD